MPEMVFPVIGRLLAQRSSNRHLRHVGGAAATNQTAIGEDNWDASARCLERRIHAGTTGANHQNIRLRLLVAHEPIESPADPLAHGRQAATAVHLMHAAHVAKQVARTKQKLMTKPKIASNQMIAGLNAKAVAEGGGSQRGCILSPSQW
jgi:hypothetical protein